MRGGSHTTPRLTTRMQHPMSSRLSERARGATSSAIRDLLKLTEQPGILSLAGGLPNAGSFPVAELRRAAMELLDASGTYGPGALQYGRTEGITPLRELVAAHRISPTDPEHVVITTGSQQAIDLLGRVLIDRGDVVVVESPSYVGALQALRAYDPQLVGVPGDGEGIDTEALERLLAGGLRPVACYVVANFANPTGATLSAVRRAHLLELARRYEFVILEDDPYGELRFRGTPTTPIRDLPGAADHVVALGTVSKVLAPGLRVGWAVLPEWLVSPLVIAKQAVDLHTSTLSQHLAVALLSDAEAQAERVRANAARYGRHAEALHAALGRHLGEVLEVRPVDGGMFLWACCTDPSADTAAMLPLAVDAGVAYVPGTAFSVGDDDAAVLARHLRMSFATLEPEQFDEAARRLALALVPAR